MQLERWRSSAESVSKANSIPEWRTVAAYSFFVASDCMWVLHVVVPEEAGNRGPGKPETRGLSVGRTEHMSRIWYLASLSGHGETEAFQAVAEVESGQQARCAVLYY